MKETSILQFGALNYERDKDFTIWGTWVAQWVKHLTLGFGSRRGLWVEIKPCVWLESQRSPTVCPSSPLGPYPTFACAHACTLSLK